MSLCAEGLISQPDTEDLDPHMTKVLLWTLSALMHFGQIPYFHTVVFCHPSVISVGGQRCCFPDFAWQGSNPKPCVRWSREQLRPLGSWPWLSFGCSAPVATQARSCRPQASGPCHQIGGLLSLSNHNRSPTLGLLTPQAERTELQQRGGRSGRRGKPCSPGPRSVLPMVRPGIESLQVPL